MYQALTFVKEVAIQTCNLSEMVHNRWIQALKRKMINVYYAIVDDFALATLQSMYYFNYLRSRPLQIGSYKCKVQLCHASKSRNFNHVVKLLDRVAIEVGMNTRVPYLKEETIFWNTIWKLNLPPSNDSDSYH